MSLLTAATDRLRSIAGIHKKCWFWGQRRNSGGREFISLHYQFASPEFVFVTCLPFPKKFGSIFKSLEILSIRKSLHRPNEEEDRGERVTWKVQNLFMSHIVNHPFCIDFKSIKDHPFRCTTFRQSAIIETSSKLWSFHSVEFHSLFFGNMIILSFKWSFMFISKHIEIYANMHSICIFHVATDKLIFVFFIDKKGNFAFIYHLKNYS